MKFIIIFSFIIFNSTYWNYSINKLKLNHTLSLIIFLYVLLYACGGGQSNISSSGSVANIESAGQHNLGNIITVYSDKDIGFINKSIFGNNFKSRDPVNTEPVPYYAMSDYGTGVWDPKMGKPNEKVMSLAIEAGVSIVRFAVGNHWDWGNAIGNNREHFLFGIDEFMETMEVIGSKAVFIVSPTIGDERDAADLVEYLNAQSNGSNINGGVNWAQERAMNGHPEPYNVKYFEIGNETYGEGSRIGRPQLYVDIYLKYFDAMKAVDPSIKIGFVLPPNLWHSWFTQGEVLSVIKDKLDYGIIHRYINSIWSEDVMKTVSAEDRFKIALSMPLLTINVEIPEYLKRLKDYSGKDIPLAISEYNSWHLNNQHWQLGAALLNAELLKILIKPEHKILMANHWQMSNGLYGMIRADKAYQNNPYSLPINYIKRPNYYVFELYNKHFGDVLVESDVQGDFYDISTYQFYNEIIEKYSLGKFSASPNTQIPYLSVNASKSIDGTEVYLMVINKNMDSSVTSLVDLKNITPLKKADIWILNGPSVDSTNEEREKQVKITHNVLNIDKNPFTISFEPHSITAIGISAN